MPELPEVETMRRGVLDVVGQKISEVDILPCKLKPIHIGPNRRQFSARVKGRRIVDIQRWGKRVVFRLDNRDSIIFEPRMTGLLLIADPPNQTHLRLGLRFRRGPVRRVLYWDRRGLGNVRLLTEEEFEDQLGPDRLGPDALRIRVDELRERLKSSRREIKVALLDQRVVAGIGNLYASEILHLAGVHPQKRCDQLTRDMWKGIHKRMYQVLETAIKYEGSTLGDGTYRNALNQDGSYQNQHRVYMRESESCLSCGGGRIRKIVQAQRSTFFCPSCQKKSGRKRG